MSYETSPILNRIKITKGWKNPMFPTKTLNYSRDMLLWFKVYLFLKVYLWCQNIRLLTCELRISEVHTKILYLSISKYIPKKKNVKSKWKTKSLLQNTKSPLIKKQSKKSRFLLYRDLRTLKRKSELFSNINHKKIYSKAWISKSRQSSWVNFSHILQRQRVFQKTQYNFFWRKKQTVFFFQKNIVRAQSIFLKKSQFYSKFLGRNQFFWKKTQKNIFQLLIKVKKDLLFLEKTLDKISTQRFKNTPKAFQILAVHLGKEYQKRKNFLEKIETLYKSYLTKKIELETKRKPTLNSFSKYFATQIYQRKIHVELKTFLFFLKKKWTLFKRQIFFNFFKKKTMSVSQKYFWQHSFLQFLINRQKKNGFQKFEDAQIFTKINKILLARNLNILFPKIRSFRTPGKLREWHLFQFLRFEQKRQQLHRNKKKKSTNYFKKKKKNKTPLRTNVVSMKKRKPSQQKLSYRLSFRYNYRNHLTLKTDLTLKYIIADLIQQYFLLRTSVKLFWPLKQFKNLKFYRLIFPNYQQWNLKKNQVSWTVNKNLNLKNKHYVYIGRNTNRLKIQEKILKSNKKFSIYKQICRKNKIKQQKRKNTKKTKVKRKTLLTDNKMSKKQCLSSNLSHLWQSKLKKKNNYLILKKKIIQSQSEKRLFWASKQPFMSDLTKTLTLFAKYLEVQPLADYLAKIIGDTKKHALILKIIKTVLRTLPFKRGIGYRIALIGRINGANKSRTLYLKKLNRNRPRQTFAKNVNFAMAQARATIGAFGVKIWVYS